MGKSDKGTGDKMTITRDMSKDPVLWMLNMTIDHIHPKWHVGAKPLNYKDFEPIKPKKPEVKRVRLGVK